MLLIIATDSRGAYQLLDIEPEFLSDQRYFLRTDGLP